MSSAMIQACVYVHIAAIKKGKKMTEFNITIDELTPYCQGFSKEQLEQARQICLEYRLTPVKRQIFIQKRWTKNGDIISPLVTIDGLRGIAERTGKYEGQVGAFWCGKDGKWTDVWLSEDMPLAAKVGVHKTGFRDALYAVAKFEEYKQVDKEKKVSGLWGKMPDLMIAKCAEALALRRAFPDELGGLYTKEEMGQSDNPEKSECQAMEEKPRAPSISMALDREQAEQIHAQAIELMNAAGSIEALGKVWAGYAKTIKSMPEDLAVDMVQKKDECKADFLKQSEGVF